mmetsp:Transcript_1895/g.3983  ORF Transcript_1895/g.3983 Transcript_1895/m.3983 type:complete len:94 (+) Transcript_1895:1046-1327(+)
MEGEGEVEGRKFLEGGRALALRASSRESRSATAESERGGQQGRTVVSSPKTLTDRPFEMRKSRKEDVRGGRDQSEERNDAQIQQETERKNELS